MESVGSSFGFVILFIGIILFMKKQKVVGVLFIIFFLLFFTILPIISYEKYKRSIEGIYVSQSKKELIINSNGYTIKDGDKTISDGSIEFSNVNGFSFSLFFDRDFEILSDNAITGNVEIFIKKK
jgi:ABC-type bacteriocin/lantibiotic exporter with double-glycine peptidase domain